jgi:hypothetical protein
MKKSLMILSSVFILFILLALNPIAVEATATALIAKPKVLLESYSIKEGYITPGEVFNITFVLKNMSTKESITDLLVDFSSIQNEIYPVYGKSAQGYVENLGPGETAEINLEMVASDILEQAAASMDISLVYSDSNLPEINNIVAISLPVSLKSSLVIQNYSIPETVTQGTLSRVSVTYENSGTLDVSNIVMHIKKSSEPDELLTELGSLAGGEKNFVESYIDFSTVGVETINIYFTYQNEDGEVLEANVHEAEIVVEKEQTVVQNVTVTEEAEDNQIYSKNNMVTLLLVLSIIAFSVLAIIIYRRNRK